MTYFLPPQECPACGKYLDCASGFNCDGKPRPGDVTVCFGCGAILEFQKGLKFRLVPDAEANTTEDLEDARKARAKVLAMIRAEAGE